MPGLQRLANFLISVRVAEPPRLAVQGQHPAALTAVIAVPHVAGQVDRHLPPAVAADGAVHMELPRPLPPDVQAEEAGHVHDVKWKICTVGHRGSAPSIVSR